MKSRLPVLLGLCLVAAAVGSGPLRANHKDAVATVESAAEVLDAMCNLQLKCIPSALMQDAQGVAIIPNVIKAGFVIGGRHGKGVIVVREPDGCWSNPIFISMTGGSIGWQIGVQSTDVVLVFKTKNSLDRIIKGKGKLTLGADAAVAAGPLGRQAEAGTDGQLKAEIYSYSRSRGLFAGVSVEGAGILIDNDSNECFYRYEAIKPADIVNMRGVPVPAVVEKLRGQLSLMSAPPPAVVYPQPLVPQNPETTPPPLAPPIPIAPQPTPLPPLPPPPPGPQ